MELGTNGILFLVTNAFLVGGIYAGIRADIKSLIKKTEEAQESARHAHRRIDDYLMKK